MCLEGTFRGGFAEEATVDDGGARAASSEQSVSGAEVAAAVALATNIGALWWYVMCQPKGNINREVVTVGERDTSPTFFDCFLCCI